MQMRMTPLALRAATLGLLAGLIAAPALAQRAEDTLRVVWRDAVPNLDPYYNALRTGLVVANQVWDTLIYRDPETFQLKPLLAATWRYVDDTTIEFTLRPDVKFHDGSPLTADDVVYTVQVATTDEKVVVPTNYAFLAGAERVDDLRVRLKLKHVFPAALEYLAMTLPILPKAYRERVGAGFSEQPVGSGPYKVTAVDGLSSITLERNDGYFGGPKGKPAIKRIYIREVTDPADEIAAIKDGSADWIWQFSPDEIDGLSSRPEIQVLHQESMRLNYMALDAAGRTGGGNPLTDRKVRRAIMMAINRDGLSHRYMPGSRVLDAPCYPTQFGCDQAEARHYAYDPDGARKLLADAGYPDGFQTKLVGYLQPSWQYAIKNDLAAVGIFAKVEQLPVGAALESSMAGHNPLNLGSWGSYSINDISAFLPVFFAGGGQDYARDPELEKLVAAGGATTDPDQRRASYSAAIQRITDQAYFLPLFTGVTTYAVSRDLRFKPFADELPRFYLTSWR